MSRTAGFEATKLARYAAVRLRAVPFDDCKAIVPYWARERLSECASKCKTWHAPWARAFRNVLSVAFSSRSTTSNPLVMSDLKDRLISSHKSVLTCGRSMGLAIASSTLKGRGASCDDVDMLF